jgi:hypothetical protein
MMMMTRRTGLRPCCLICLEWIVLPPGMYAYKIYCMPENRFFYILGIWYIMWSRLVYALADSFTFWSPLQPEPGYRSLSCHFLVIDCRWTHCVCEIWLVEQKVINFFFFCFFVFVLVRLDSLIWAWASSFRWGFMVTHIWDTPQSVGLLWTRDQLVAETSTWQHTTLTRDRHPCPRWDSNPRRRPHGHWDRQFKFTS